MSSKRAIIRLAIASGCLLVLGAGCSVLEEVSPETTLAPAAPPPPPVDAAAPVGALPPAEAPVTPPPVAAPAAVDGVNQRNPGDFYSQYGVYERVQFAPGTSGTTISGGIVRGEVNGYLFGASAGQRMTVDLASDNAIFDIFAPDDTLIDFGQSAIVDPLGMNGDYLVVVQSESGNASFTLSVQITSPASNTGASGQGADEEGAAEASPCPAGYQEWDGNYPLRICHKGPTVTTLQALLADLGYNIAVDGFFGESTRAALSAEFLGAPGEITNPVDFEALRTCDADC